ncbi:MAG: hypothetical protein EA406_01135 [Rhodospirillales bacterium]|nr:MAG: hypothetical protein EA406_01135 [Rhodospirillales bacterium]
MDKLTIAQAVRANARMLDHVPPSRSNGTDRGRPARGPAGNGGDDDDDAEAWALVALHRRQLDEDHWRFEQGREQAVLRLFR